MPIHRILTPLAVLLLAILYVGFVLVTERLSTRHSQNQINEHARILADDLWHFNSEGMRVYLNLAAASSNYASIAVTSSNGELFQEIIGPAPKPLEQALIDMDLIPSVRLMSQIQYNGAIIGWLEAVHLPRTIFLQAYVLFALFLVAALCSLYARLLREKYNLEERVRHRTEELSLINIELLREIEEHALAEQSLRASEEKHRLLAENIKDVIWTMDLDMNFTYISPVACQVHGWAKEELGSLTPRQLLTPQSYTLVRQHLEQYTQEWLRSGDYDRNITLELELNNKDGSTMWGEITASVLRNDRGRPVGLVGVTRDISERLRTTLEKAELHQQLERSRKMESLGLLAGGVAHDLNNVLSGIVSYPELLLMDLPKNSELRKPIMSIQNSGLKAAAIVQDLLTLARRGVVKKQVVNLNTLIREYMDSPEKEKLRELHPDTTFHLRLEENLPNIEGTPIQLRKTLMNLVVNGVEAQPDGGTITISTRRCYLDLPLQGYQTIAEGEWVVLSIRDQGEGIAPQDLEHIFEPFYTKKIMGRSGTGLGLAVVWGTLEDHGGSVDIRSEPGFGTEFTLYLPMTRKQELHAEEQAPPREFRGRGEHLLVVDDIDYQRDIARSLLQRLDYRVDVAESGEAAVAYLREHPVDLVILDMIMDGGIDGLETYRRMAEIRPGQKAIIVSGYSENERIGLAQQAGAGEYLRKPYMLHDIGRAVRNALDTA